MFLTYTYNIPYIFLFIYYEQIMFFYKSDKIGNKKNSRKNKLNSIMKKSN